MQLPTLDRRRVLDTSKIAHNDVTYSHISRTSVESPRVCPTQAFTVLGSQCKHEWHFLLTVTSE